MGNDNDYWDDEFFRMHYMSGENSGGSYNSDGCLIDLFKIVVIVIAIFVVLALLLGVEMNGAVIGFFFKVILVVGWFAFLSFLFGGK